MNASLKIVFLTPGTGGWYCAADLLRGVARHSHMTSARDHGAMTLAMLRMEDSGLDKELDKLTGWLLRKISNPI